MSHEHKHTHRHGKHGNPEDFAGYVARLDSPERDEWQKPEQVLDALSLEPGFVVGEIGAGPGYFSLRLAKRVRTVFSVEVEPRMIELLRDRIAAAHVHNVVPVLGLEGDPLLPEATCDRVLVVDTFHHFPDPVRYLRRLAAALKPGGRLVNIDFHKRELPVGPSIDHLIAREDFLATAADAGLELVAEHSFLPYQYFLELRPR